MLQYYPSQYNALMNLGGGVLYNGALELSSQTPERQCVVRMRNELQNEDVVTICERVKKYGDSSLVQPMGVLYDRDMKIDSSRVFRGKIGADGLAEVDASGQYALFVKDLGAGNNNVNLAWVDYSEYARNQVVPDVATTNVDEQTQNISLTWNVDSEYTENKGVSFAPVYQLNDNGE